MILSCIFISSSLFSPISVNIFYFHFFFCPIIPFSTHIFHFKVRPTPFFRPMPGKSADVPDIQSFSPFFLLQWIWRIRWGPLESEDRLICRFLLTTTWLAIDKKSILEMFSFLLAVWGSPLGSQQGDLVCLEMN